MRDGQVLLVGGLEQADTGALRVPGEAVVVDASTGGSSTVPAPEADMSTRVVEATGGVDGFVVIGARCPEGDRLSILEPVCSARSATAFLLRPGADVWEEIPFPDRVSPPRTPEPWTFQSLVAATPGGDVFALVSGGPNEIAYPPWRLLVLRDGEWVERATMPDVDPKGVCASREAYYVLTSDTSPPPTGEHQPGPGREGPPPPARMALYEVPFGGGEPSPVSLPDVDTSMAGVAVSLACDRGGPYLTSSTPTSDAPMVVFARRAGRWETVEGDWSPGLVQRTHSAPDGVAIEVTMLRPIRLTVHTVAAGEQAARALDPRFGHRLLAPDPVDGGFVTVGPLPHLSTELEAADPSAREDEDITIETLGL